MPRLMGLIFAACLLAIGTSTSVPAADPNWPKSLTLGTASPGGLYYIYGEALAKILTEKLGIPVNPLPTQGPVHNVKLLDSGGAQLGLITMGIGLQGWNGTGDWTNGKRFRNMRALFPMYDTPFQAVVLRRSGIATLAQLDKQALRHRTASRNRRHLWSGNIEGSRDFGRNRAMDRTTKAAELLAGRIDALRELPGRPARGPGTWRRRSRSHSSVFPPNKLMPSAKRCRSSAPQRSLPEPTPPGQGLCHHRGLQFCGWPSRSPGRSGLPIGQGGLREPARLVKATSAASETLPQNVVKNTFLPFHPGAVRYYREIGISIPDALAATN